MDELSSALDGFAVLAQDATELAGGVARAFAVEEWPTPSFSPVIHLAAGMPDAAELAAVERYWSDRFGALAPPACLLLPVTGPAPEPIGAHWHPDDRPLHVIVEPVAAVESAQDSAVRITPLGDRAAEQEFLELVTACFPDAAADPDRVLRQLRRAEAHTDLITLDSGTPTRPTATCAVTFKNGTAFQSWGAVPEPYRGQGLSRRLQADTMNHCQSAGATVSVTVTRNPRVIGTERPRLDLWIYRNSAPGDRR